MSTSWSRVQSPSSINTWRQCPRKYFYKYIATLPGFPSIHLIRGKVVHSTLEKFFDTDVSRIHEASFFMTMHVVLGELFKKEWAAAAPQFSELELSPERVLGYYDETKSMVNNYFEYFSDKMKFFLRTHPTSEAWKSVTPQRELHVASDAHGVHGFMDAIHDEVGKTLILDYKTSRRATLTPEYELQLSIYALLYQERFRTPDMVGVFFLKEGKEVLVDVSPGMIERAKRDVAACHLGTRSNEIGDYPKRPGPLCRWSTGQCDYYEYCFEGKPLEPPQQPEPVFFLDIETKD